MTPNHHHIADALADAALYEISRKVAQASESLNRSIGQQMRRVRERCGVPDRSAIQSMRLERRKAITPWNDYERAWRL